jgi:hypothetical protein
MLKDAARSNGHKDRVFSHSFLVIMWNLMCRAVNVTTILLAHIEMRGDAMAIHFAQQKTDQVRGMNVIISVGFSSCG